MIAEGIMAIQQGDVPLILRKKLTAFIMAHMQAEIGYRVNVHRRQNRLPSMIEQRKEIGNIWLIIFSDITTNLMLFFLMLFAMTRMTASDKQMVVAGMESTVVNQSAREQAELERQAKMQREEEAIKRLQLAVADGTLAGKATISGDGQGRQYRAQSRDRSFPSAAPNSIPARSMSWKAWSGLIQMFPNDIIIEGHTDHDTGARRGLSFQLGAVHCAGRRGRQLLHCRRHRSPKQLIAAGYGEFHPAYPNDSEVNRARNRRIEITLVRQAEEHAVMSVLKKFVQYT